ncbi:MAG: hypothetical protein IJU59_01440 [Firmicutes bacterium]|nr:hypothetical protein [Bacillota bacterium]
MKKIITIAIAIVCCAVSVVSLAEPYEPADDSAVADTIAMLEAQYSTLEGQIVWADEEEFAVYEVFKKEAGTYTTSIGKIKPIIVGVATVVRSKEDSSFVRVETLPYIEIVASNADWDGGDFSINNDGSGIIRISSVGCFFRGLATSSKPPVKSENVTVAVYVNFE